MICLHKLNPIPELKLNVDRTQIEQILINLLKNAREACSRKSDKKIQVKARKLSAGNTTLTISDNGEGILPDVDRKSVV